MTQGDIRLSCLSNDRSIRALLSRVMPMLGDWGLADPDLDTIELVLAEALNNIAEHAFPMEDGAVISLHLMAADGMFQVRLHDRGNPMPGLCLPEGTAPDPTVGRCDLPEGGFGWFLIRKQTDRLIYSRQHTGNHLEFSIRLSESGSVRSAHCCQNGNMNRKQA